MSSSRPRRYAIVGSGALGGYFGARLHHGGCEVHFLFHRDLEHVRRHGLRVDSRDGDFSIAQPHAHGWPENMPTCDVVLLGLKTTENHRLAELLPPLVRGGAAVLVMQNGFGIEEQVAAAAQPRGPIVGGLAFLCSNKVGPGHIRHLDYGQIRLGQYEPRGAAAGITPVMEKIAADFSRAGIPIELEEDLRLARWKKLVWNVPYNGLCALLRVTTDRLMSFGPTRELCEQLMREVVAGAAADGRVIDGDFITLMMSNTDRMVAYKPSMLYDRENGRPMEIEAIYGNTLAAAAERGTRLPRIEMLYRQLQLVEEVGSDWATKRPSSSNFQL
jgi:2-dehydropantoate 2-reductase